MESSDYFAVCGKDERQRKITWLTLHKKDTSALSLLAITVFELRYFIRLHYFLQKKLMKDISNKRYKCFDQ